jgi:adenylate cyclase
MFTDMVGYTALGQRNESLSLALVEEQRKQVRPILSRHNGREVKTIGDAFLVEFPNAVDAVRCAYDIQRAIREFNISLPAESRIHLRIGVHVGEVVESGGDISGDAVNVASRIESLAEDGGVCLTRQVYDHVQNKFELELESLGNKSLKNITAQLEVYKMVMPWGEERAIPSTQLDKRRIAVLPFSNISLDPADEYFADGMTEELIDRLSQVGGLKVIARTSVMSYKGKEKKASEIGKELRVGTLVEGSVRKVSNKIRVTAQLIDTSTEEHLWSSRYDKDLDDIFAVQGDIASRITESLSTNLFGKRSSVSGEGGTTNVTAYSHFLQGRQLLNQAIGGSLRRALSLFEEAAAADPSFARAHSSIADCYVRLGYAGLLSYDDAVRGAKQAAQKALVIDENLADAHVLLSEIAWIEDDHVKDEAEAKRAIELNSSLADAYAMLARIKAKNGYPSEAIGLYEEAYKLDPLSQRIIGTLGSMYFDRGREKEAEEYWSRNFPFAPVEVLVSIANSCLSKGAYEKAEETIESLERDSPEDMRTVTLRGYLAALRGDRMVAEKTIMRLEEKFKSGPTVNTSIGCIRYFMGDMDAFFEAMFRDVENHTLNPNMLRYSPLFEKARQDPRYPRVMLKNGLDPELKE